MVRFLGLNHITEALLRRVAAAGCDAGDVMSVMSATSVCVASAMSANATVCDMGSAPRTNCSCDVLSAPPYLKLRLRLDLILFAESLFRTNDLRRKSLVRDSEFLEVEELGRGLSSARVRVGANTPL